MFYITTSFTLARKRVQGTKLKKRCNFTASNHEIVKKGLFEFVQGKPKSIKCLFISKYKEQDFSDDTKAHKTRLQ